MALPPGPRWVTVGEDLRLPVTVLEQLVEDLQPYDIHADLNVVGEGTFVILEHDADAAWVPDGTFIARLPEGIP